MKLSACLTIFLTLLFSGGPGSGTEKAASPLMQQLVSIAGEAPPPPEVTEAKVVELEEGDPETFIFIDMARSHPPKPKRFGGDGFLSLTRKDTGERVSVRYRRRDGSYSRKALGKINQIMRCSLTGSETDVAVKLVELLDAVEDHFGKQGLILLSGYRTPKLNHIVPGAARRSLHMLGWAADIRVPGESSETVAKYARRLRAGGVGRYPDAAFTHLDVGRTRQWLVRNTQTAAGR